MSTPLFALAGASTGNAAEGILAYVGSVPIKSIPAIPGIPTNPASDRAGSIAHFQRLLMSMYAKEHGLTVTEEEINSKWKEMTRDLSDTAFKDGMNRMDLVLDGIAESLKDKQAGEVFYQDKLSSFLDKSAWAAAKKQIADEEELKKQRSALPRDLSAAKADNVKIITEQILVSKALAAITGDVDPASEAVAKIVIEKLRAKDPFHAKDTLDRARVEADAIQIVKNARFALWMKDQLSRSDVRIIDEAFAKDIEAKIEHAKRVLGPS